MEHEFLEGFKPVNIKSYNGTIDPSVWIDDFLLHIHMARGDDLHAIKYLPLKPKGPCRCQNRRILGRGSRTVCLGGW